MCFEQVSQWAYDVIVSVSEFCLIVVFVCSCIVFSLVECLLIRRFVKYTAQSFCCWIFFSCYFQNYIFLLISNDSDSLLKCIWCSWLNGFENYMLLLKCLECNFTCVTSIVGRSPFSSCALSHWMFSHCGTSFLLSCMWVIVSWFECIFNSIKSL